MAAALTPKIASIEALKSRTMQAQNDVNKSQALPKDLLKLKEVSEKLNLSTRRPSVVQWKQVIEHRRARGQYITSGKLQYLDTIVATRLSESDTTEEMTLNTVEIDNIENVNSLFEETDNTPSKANHPPTSEAMVPTPLRRHRRSAQIETPVLVTEGNDVQVKIDDVTDDVTDSDCSSQSTITDVSTPEVNDTNSRYRQIDQAFQSIRRELVLMRIEDNKLARKLLNIRSEMNLLRAQCSCQEHADMLDDVTFELQEEEELTGLIKACDLSSGKPDFLFSNFSPLRSIGVNRMNLNTRRFSIR